MHEEPFGGGSSGVFHEDVVGDLSASCPTRTSVLGLAVTCALLVVLYVCTVFCVCIRRVASRGTKKTSPMGTEYMR